MKKKHLVSALALMFTVSVAGTAFAASNFPDVPTDHWAYDAINTLVKNKVIDGAGDGTYQGDRPMTRYEMALIVEKALEKEDKANFLSKAAIDKLKEEFAPELKKLGARVDKVEKKVDKLQKQIGGFSFTGDDKLFYGKNESLEGNNKATSPGKDAGRFANRMRVGVKTTIDDNWSVAARFGSQNVTGSNKLQTTTPEYSSVNGEFFIDRAELKYKPTNDNNWVYTLGRSYLSTTHKFVEDATFDGLTALYKNDKLRAKFMIGDQSPALTLWTSNIGGFKKGTVTGTTAATYASKGAYMDTSYTWWGDFGYKLTDNVNVNALVMKNISRTMPFDLLGIGADIKMGDFKLITDYTKNRYDFATNLGSAIADTQRYGYWYKLEYKGADSKKPGTWGLDVAYERIGTASVDCTTLSFMNWSYGMKGYETHYTYAFAKGATIDFGYGKFKPIDASKFSSFNNAYLIETNFKF